MNGLEKKQDQRRRFLRALYDATGGRRLTFILAPDIGTKLGLTQEEYTSTTDYLVGRGWMKWETLEGKASITPAGVDEAEQLIAADAPQPERPHIPAPVIAEISRAFDATYTHAQIDNIFMEASAPGAPPEGSKLRKVAAWLHRINAASEVDALDILGRLVKEFLARPRWGTGLDPNAAKMYDEEDSRFLDALAAHGLSYHDGKIFGAGLLAPSKTLAELIRARDLTAIGKEFERAADKIVSDPEGAVTAACAILEATCLTYIADEGLTLPADKSLGPLWKVVQRHLGIAPTPELDEDLKRVLGGLASIVAGVGAFRTHAGDAHGRGPGAPSIDPRHARLAVHAAHTVVTFILETWKRTP